MRIIVIEYFAFVNYYLIFRYFLSIALLISKYIFINSLVNAIRFFYAPSKYIIIAM